jgi:hypothetical protein
MDFAGMGIDYYKTAYEFYPGWVLAHGDEGSMSQHAGITALNLAKKWGKSVIAGHSHRLGMSAYTEAIGSHYRALYGVEVGNLMDQKKSLLYPLWKRELADGLCYTRSRRKDINTHVSAYQ